MAVYLAKESEAMALLSHRLVYVGGEVVFLKVFQHQLQPVRRHNCQQCGHKAARCRRNRILHIVPLLRQLRAPPGPANKSTLFLPVNQVFVISRIRQR